MIKYCPYKMNNSDPDVLWDCSMMDCAAWRATRELDDIDHIHISGYCAALDCNVEHIVKKLK